MNKDNPADIGAIGFLANLRKAARLQIDIENDVAQSEYPTSYMVMRELNPSQILRWEGKGRSENELGDIDGLANSIVEVGQISPCIVRLHKTEKGMYELIVGERRWRAAKKAGIKLKVIVNELDDRMAALVEIAENEHRAELKNLSDFERGMSYAKKIEAGEIRQKDLPDILNLSKQQVSRLLSFGRIPKPIFDAIGDFSKISATTAEEICRLSAKGEKYMSAIISLADHIREGVIANHRLKTKIDAIVTSE